MKNINYLKFVFLFALLSCLNFLLTFGVDWLIKPLDVRWNIAILILYLAVGFFLILVVLGLLFEKVLVWSCSVAYSFFIVFFKLYFAQSVPENFYFIIIVFYQIFSTGFYIVFCYSKKYFIFLIFIFFSLVFIVTNNTFFLYKNMNEVKKKSTYEICFDDSDYIVAIEYFAKNNNIEYIIEKQGRCIVFEILPEEHSKEINEIIKRIIFEKHIKR